MGIIKDIASFHSASASTLVYQTDPSLLGDFDVEATIIITSEDGAAAVGLRNICLVVPLRVLGLRAVDYLVSKPDFGPGVSSVSPNAIIADDTAIHLQRSWLGPALDQERWLKLAPSCIRR